MSFARTTDPQTSHDAAARLSEFVPMQDALIMRALRERGPMAAEQVGDIVGLHMVQVCRRWAALKRAGQIEVFEAGGHRNRSGRMADIMIAVKQLGN